MADFVAVLRKTLDGLGETTPETRARVYDKARATVSAKLAAINPPPPAAVAERQRKALEDAINSVESEYAPAKPTFDDPLEELESVFAALKEGKPITPARPAVAPAQPAAQGPSGQPAAQNPVARREPSFGPVTKGETLPPKSESAPAIEPALKAKAEPKFETATRAQPAPEQPPFRFEPARTQPAPVEEDEVPFASDESADEPYEAPQRHRAYGGLIAAAVGALIVAGAGYGVWLNKNEFGQMLGLGETPAADPATPATDSAATPPPAGETDVAANQPADAQPNSQQAPAEEPKLTQRLNEDGSEVDAGPAGGQETFGEGTSVAALTTPVAADLPPATPPAGTPPADTTAAAPADAASVPPADGAAPADPATPPATGQDAAVPPATQPAQTAAVQPAGQEQLAVGQRAIFYEERTSVAQGSAEPGSIVWSEVQESPGGDAPPEPAIRAEATIPGKDIQLRMTIRRNADKTLPASHIVEMIFLTPENFEGGGIDNVLRIAFKNSEQDAGSPLVGIPAKIADGFFLIALNDSKNEIDNNLNLLKRQSWIDIPIVYKNGRRALFTMEKGVPGEKVFEDTLKAWEPKTAG